MAKPSGSRARPVNRGVPICRWMAVMTSSSRSSDSTSSQAPTAQLGKPPQECLVDGPIDSQGEHPDAGQPGRKGVENLILVAHLTVSDQHQDRLSSPVTLVAAQHGDGLARAAPPFRSRPGPRSLPGIPGPDNDCGHWPSQARPGIPAGSPRRYRRPRHRICRRL